MAYQALQRTSGIQVREKVSLIEAATAMMGQEVEMANKYKIFDESGDRELFYAVEKTDCCTRQLKQCMGDCAPWNVEILYTEGGAQQKAFVLERGFTCTCCCFNRPKVQVTDVSRGETIGYVVDPCACCGLTFKMLDAGDNIVNTAEGGCCQLGLCCPMPCGPCATVSFDINNPSGNKVGQMTKKVPGCCKFFFAPDVDNYRVDFSGIDDPKARALLMALTIFVDFRYFSDNSNDEGQQNPPVE
mmetsp:Transcript_73080/g.138124  ORF Transcript_73080/g.138124 Transcript_73080/m.138124 type:complete len:244 (-) Transcript_73080:40-771(-)